MPIQPINYASITPQGNPMARGIISGMQQGMSFPQQMLQMQLANQKSQAELPYAGEIARTTALYKAAMANYLMQPNQMLKYMTNVGKTYVEPNVVNALMQGRGAMGQPMQQNGAMNGMQQPQMGTSQIQPMNSAEGQQQQPGTDNSAIGNIYNAYRQKQAYDPAQSHQAQAAQIIYNQVNKIDTKPLEAFSGLGGKIKLAKEQAKGIASSFGMDVKPSDDFRKYTSYMAVNKNTIMDGIRNALKTSIVPPFVASTLRPMVDPSAPVWNDPEQVRKNIETLKYWVGHYAGEQTEAMAKGVAPSLEESSKRDRELTKALKNSQATKNEGMAQYSLGNKEPEGVVQDIKKIGKQSYHKINGSWFPVEGE